MDERGAFLALLRLGGKTILLDPYLGEVAGPVRSLSPRRFVPPAPEPEETTDDRN